MFIHSDLTYLWLVPEAFMTDGHVSEEKLVRCAMSFMAKDTAAVAELKSQLVGSQIGSVICVVVGWMQGIKCWNCPRAIECENGVKRE
jgi:hypothetical protein